MKKIEIKLKECCLDCEHFDPPGCTGLTASVFCCGEPERVIACGHMAVCKKYLELSPPSCCELERQEITPQKTGWISVKDKPVPEDDVRYIVYAHYHEKAEVECTKGWACGTNVTHWMPLPEPPK